MPGHNNQQCPGQNLDIHSRSLAAVFHTPGDGFLETQAPASILLSHPGNSRFYVKPSPLPIAIISDHFRHFKAWSRPAQLCLAHGSFRRSHHIAHKIRLTGATTPTGVKVCAKTPTPGKRTVEKAIFLQSRNFISVTRCDPLGIFTALSGAKASIGYWLVVSNG